jgi:glucokinase
MILAGDIGGTSTRLGTFDVQGGRPVLVDAATFSSRDYVSLDHVVREFVESRSIPIEHACFAVAGPVANGRVKTSNLPWVIEASALSALLQVRQVWVINDLEAAAYGLALLEEQDLLILNPGAPQTGGNAAIIAAGTGLGEAGLYWDGQQHHPFACEGGHADFAPRTTEEVDLLQHLQQRFGRVSYERVVSGPGLENIYQFMREPSAGEEPAWFVEHRAQRGAAAAISHAALQGTCDVARRALDLFVSVYGAEAGNLALKMLAIGGLYVGGGIAPRIAAKLADGTFMEAFVAKGRMRALLEAIPVRVVLNEHTGLLGAARVAALRASVVAI